VDCFSTMPFQFHSQVDRDFKEAEAALDFRTISKLQSQMLEALFEIYFRCEGGKGRQG